MKYLIFVVLALALGVTAVSAAEPMPKYLQDLDRPYHAGDWTLQCNGARLCQIIGVVKIPRNHVGVRAIVMIRRGIAKDAKLSLRFAFVDALGSLGVPTPAEGWRLYSRGLPKMPPPIKLGLGQADEDGAYRATPEVAAKIISALKRWPGSVIHDRGQRIAKMPKGDLARLFRKMDKLQHPKKPRMTAEETAQWLQEYHYVTLRSVPFDDNIPESVLVSCDTRTYVNRPFGVRIGPEQVLFTADCPEGSKVFVQRNGQDPVKFDVTDAQGQIHPHNYAGFNTDTSLLEIQIPKSGNEGCGRWLKLGYTGDKFAMIKDQRYDRCRAVPYDFWPIVWSPTSWKYADIPPTNGGNAPPAIEGVKTP
jgi:hypothetical protein